MPRLALCLDVLCCRRKGECGLRLELFDGENPIGAGRSEHGEWKRKVSEIRPTRLQARRLFVAPQSQTIDGHSDQLVTN